MAANKNYMDLKFLWVLFEYFHHVSILWDCRFLQVLEIVQIFRVYSDLFFLILLRMASHRLHTAGFDIIAAPGLITHQ